MDKHIEYVLKEMCDRVGADFDNIDPTEPFWFYDHEWTQQEEEDFKDWLVDYLLNHKEARKSTMRLPTKKKSVIDQVASQFVFQFGWKQKESDG